MKRLIRSRNSRVLDSAGMNYANHFLRSQMIVGEISTGRKTFFQHRHSRQHSLARRGG